MKLIIDYTKKIKEVCQLKLYDGINIKDFHLIISKATLSLIKETRANVMKAFTISQHFCVPI